MWGKRDWNRYGPIVGHLHEFLKQVLANKDASPFLCYLVMVVVLVVVVKVVMIVIC